MAVPRCCTGSWYLLPNGSLFSWAVICHACHRVLVIRDGRREDVIADI